MTTPQVWKSRTGCLSTTKGLNLDRLERDYVDAAFLDLVHTDVAWYTPVEFRNISIGPSPRLTSAGASPPSLRQTISARNCSFSFGLCARGAGAST